MQVSPVKERCGLSGKGADDPRIWWLWWDRLLMASCVGGSKAEAQIAVDAKRLSRTGSCDWWSRVNLKMPAMQLETVIVFFVTFQK